MSFSILVPHVSVQQMGSILNLCNWCIVWIQLQLIMGHPEDTRVVQFIGCLDKLHIAIVSEQAGLLELTKHAAKRWAHTIN